jgi:hypothetical protein
MKLALKTGFTLHTSALGRGCPLQVFEYFLCQRFRLVDLTRFVVRSSDTDADENVVLQNIKQMKNPCLCASVGRRNDYEGKVSFHSTERDIMIRAWDPHFA